MSLITKIGHPPQQRDVGALRLARVKRHRRVSDPQPAIPEKRRLKEPASPCEKVWGP